MCNCCCYRDTLNAKILGTVGAECWSLFSFHGTFRWFDVKFYACFRFILYHHILLSYKQLSFNIMIFINNQTSKICSQIVTSLKAISLWWSSHSNLTTTWQHGPWKWRRRESSSWKLWEQTHAPIHTHIPAHTYRCKWTHARSYTRYTTNRLITPHHNTLRHIALPYTTHIIHVT